MSIIRKVRAVERLFDRLDTEIMEFQAQSGIHCVAGCGKCCTKPDIEAATLEFLPLAYHWFLEGKAEEMLEKLNSENTAICTVYSPLSLENQISGSCSMYKYRGLICRLFGYGASRDKYGQLRLVTCKIIKEQQVESYEKAVELMRQNEYVPIFSDYYKNLLQIDFKIGGEIRPINQAIIAALEEVLHYYAYRPFPKIRKVA